MAHVGPVRFDAGTASPASPCWKGEHTLDAAATHLQETKARVAERLEETVEAYRERRVEEALDARRVEDLAEATRSSCIESLKHAGYHTIGDLHQVRSDRLQQLYGIGQVSADQVVRAVSALASVVRREPLHLPPPDEVDARHTEILAALYSRSGLATSATMRSRS